MLASGDSSEAFWREVLTLQAEEGQSLRPEGEWKGGSCRPQRQETDFVGQEWPWVTLGELS